MNLGTVDGLAEFAGFSLVFELGRSEDVAHQIVGSNHQPS